MTRPRIKTSFVVIVVAALSIVGFAAAQAGDPTQPLRQQLVDTEKELEAARATSATLMTYLDEGRIYWIGGGIIPDQTGPFAFVTREEGMLAVTLSYLMALARNDRPFDAHQLAEWISEYFRHSRDLRTYLEDLDRRMDLLRRRRAALENALAEYEGAPGGAPCLELVRVDRQQVGEGVLASTAQLGAAMSRVDAYASAAETGRGYPGDFTLQWTSPPARICLDEPFQMTATVTNHRPLPEGRLGRAAQVGYVFDPPQSVTVTCTNPPGFDPVTAAFVGDVEGGRTNTCTITLEAFHRWDEARAFIHLNVNALGSGSATFRYLYR